MVLVNLSTRSIQHLAQEKSETGKVLLILLRARQISQSRLIATQQFPKRPLACRAPRNAPIVRLAGQPPSLGISGRTLSLLFCPIMHCRETVRTDHFKNDLHRFTLKQL
jgi:hypothetical protein